MRASKQVQARAASVVGHTLQLVACLLLLIGRWTRRQEQEWHTCLQALGPGALQILGPTGLSSFMYKALEGFTPSRLSRERTNALRSKMASTASCPLGCSPRHCGHALLGAYIDLMSEHRGCSTLQQDRAHCILPTWVLLSSPLEAPPSWGLVDRTQS